MMSFCIQITNLSFSWPDESSPLLDLTDLVLEQGDTLFVEGGSGSGKSTFLELLSGVQKPTLGELKVLDTSLPELSQEQRDRFRSQHFGIIFQTLNLIPFLTVKENVALAISYSGTKKDRIRRAGLSVGQESERLLQALKIDASLWHQKSFKLSVGQQQRVAAARALIGNPEILVADEPTSALDDEATKLFMDLFLEEASKSNSTVIFVSHDKRLKPYFSKSLCIQNSIIN